MVAAIPLTRNAVIFSFCHTGKPSRKTTAILVSNFMVLAPDLSFTISTSLNQEFLAVLHNLALFQILRGNYAQESAETVRQMALVCESRGVGNFCHCISR